MSILSYIIINTLLIGNPILHSQYATSIPQKNFSVTQNLMAASTKQSTTVKAVPNKTAATSTSKNTTYPNEKSMQCQFYAQAPKGDWSQPYGDYCEEASLVLAVNCLNGDTVDVNKFIDQLHDIDKWFTDKFGKNKDQTVAQIGAAAKEKYGLKYAISDNPTFDTLKKALNSGHLVIAPLAGKMLSNPHYKFGGPDFHVVLVVGYKGNNIITHDVGTRSGEKYVYDKDTFFNALHDWTGDKKTIKQGKKRIVEVYK